METAGHAGCTSVKLAIIKQHWNTRDGLVFRGDFVVCWSVVIRDWWTVTESRSERKRWVREANKKADHLYKVLVWGCCEAHSHVSVCFGPPWQWFVSGVTLSILSQVLDLAPLAILSGCSCNKNFHSLLLRCAYKWPWHPIFPQTRPRASSDLQLCRTPAGRADVSRAFTGI